MHKYGVAAIALPFVLLAMVLSFLPTYLVWSVLIVSLGYLSGLILLKLRVKTKKKGSIKVENVRKEMP